MSAGRPSCPSPSPAECTAVTLKAVRWTRRPGVAAPLAAPRAWAAQAAPRGLPRRAAGRSASAWGSPAGGASAAEARSPRFASPAVSGRWSGLSCWSSAQGPSAPQALAASQGRSPHALGSAGWRTPRSPWRGPVPRVGSHPGAWSPERHGPCRCRGCRAQSSRAWPCHPRVATASRRSRGGGPSAGNTTRRSRSPACRRRRCGTCAGRCACRGRRPSRAWPRPGSRTNPREAGGPCAPCAPGSGASAR
mmetsp:Transcript_15910/g.47866  ORF Transcript_15910/g.47866 Transcript_15910/m.47866 type:complete len:249 (+) Transcript_15910:379-1125(+)